MTALRVALGMLQDLAESGTWPGMRLPFSSTITAGTPITKPPFPLVDCKLWMEWQVVQVRPSGSKARSTCEFCGQRARQHGNRIVAAIAMAGEFDAFGADEDVDAGAVERRAEGVGVQRLAPLV